LLPGGNHAALISAAGVYVFSFLAGISLKFAGMYSVAGVSTLPFLGLKDRTGCVILYELEENLLLAICGGFLYGCKKHGKGYYC
jgi:hypothetical protein